MSGLDGIVLDLDDTLLDTTRLLVPAADRRVARALQEHGTTTHAAEIIALLHARRAVGSQDAIGDVARHLGIDEDGRRGAVVAFLEFADDVPPLALTSDVLHALDDLRSLAPLAILTQGHLATQRAKIDRLGIAARFVEIVIVDGLIADGKIEALRALLERQGWTPRRVVVCGDRPTSDIRAANARGCRGVLVRRAGTEHATEPSDSPGDAPWRTVRSVTDLPALLRVEGLVAPDRPTD